MKGTGSLYANLPRTFPQLWSLIMIGWGWDCYDYLVGISDIHASHSFHKHPAFTIENAIRFKDIYG